MVAESTEDINTEAMMRSVRFAKGEQGRHKTHKAHFRWQDIKKKLGEHKRN